MTRALCSLAAALALAAAPATSRAQSLAPDSSRATAVAAGTPAPTADATSTPSPATPVFATVSLRPLAAGDRVRLRSAAGRYAGTLAQVSPDTFTLAAPGRMDAVVRAEVSEMHRLVSREPRGRTIVRGAALGLVVGMALGFVAGSDAGNGDGTAKVAFTADGAIVGALVGAMMGPTYRRSQWERVDATPPR